MANIMNLFRDQQRGYKHLRSFDRGDGNVRVRAMELDFQPTMSIPYRTEFGMWMYRREQNIRIERHERYLAEKREQWTAQIAATEVDDVPVETRRERLLMDDRALPGYAWQSIYYRFTRRHTFMLGRDKAGCDDLDATVSGPRGITVDVYNALTGTLVCSVDIGIDGESTSKAPLDLYDVAREVERWSDHQGKRESEGFFAECLQFFPRPQKNWHGEMSHHTCIRDISHGKYRFELNMIRMAPSRLQEFLNQEEKFDKALESVNRIRTAANCPQITVAERNKIIFTSENHENAATHPVVRGQKCTTCRNLASTRCVNCCWKICNVCRRESPWPNIAPMCHPCVQHAQWGRPRDAQYSAQ